MFVSLSSTSEGGVKNRTLLLLVWTAGALLSLLFWGALVYVVLHFIAKLW